MLPDIIGLLGVSLVIAAYCLLQTGRVTSVSPFYLYSNFWGSVMLLISLLYNWNLASVSIEIMWLIISIYGIVKYRWLK
jgi:hypothetical protein